MICGCQIKLFVQLDFMIKNGYAFTCTSYEQINESGKTLNRIVRAVSRVNYNRLLWIVLLVILQ